MMRTQFTNVLRLNFNPVSFYFVLFCTIVLTLKGRVNVTKIFPCWKFFINSSWLKLPLVGHHYNLINEQTTNSHWLYLRLREICSCAYNVLYFIFFCSIVRNCYTCTYSVIIFHYGRWAPTEFPYHFANKVLDMV